MDNPFARKIYALTRQIPEGKVSTYGQLALLAGKPRAARVVGGIMSRCPASENLPCHRVVKHNGSLCDDYTFGRIQHELLRREGVSFLPDGRVNLTASYWEGPVGLA